MQLIRRALPPGHSLPPGSPAVTGVNSARLGARWRLLRAAACRHRTWQAQFAELSPPGMGRCLVANEAAIARLDVSEGWVAGCGVGQEHGVLLGCGVGQESGVLLASTARVGTLPGGKCGSYGTHWMWVSRGVGCTHVSARRRSTMWVCNCLTPGPGGRLHTAWAWVLRVLSFAEVQEEARRGPGSDTLSYRAPCCSPLHPVATCAPPAQAVVDAGLATDPAFFKFKRVITGSNARFARALEQAKARQQRRGGSSSGGKEGGKEEVGEGRHAGEAGSGAVGGGGGGGVQEGAPAA